MMGARRERSTEACRWLFAGLSILALQCGVVQAQIPHEDCVICEYVLETIDRLLKAQPRMQNGNGYYPGVMDFGEFRPLCNSLHESRDKSADDDQILKLLQIATHAVLPAMCRSSRYRPCFLSPSFAQVVVFSKETIVCIRALISSLDPPFIQVNTAQRVLQNQPGKIFASVKSWKGGKAWVEINYADSR